jgi:2'-phosphotransferase
MESKKGGVSAITISKNLSYILRHGALSMGLQMRPDGYVALNELLAHSKMKKF